MFLFFTFYRTLLFYNNVHIFAIVFAFLSFFFFFLIKWPPCLTLQIGEAEIGIRFTFMLRNSDSQGLNLG